MPSNPLYQKLDQHIQRLGGDEVVFDQIAGGATMEEVASTFRGVAESKPDFPSRQYMYTWIKKGGEERQAAFDTARELSAHALVEDAGEILENEGVPPAHSAEMQWLKQRANHKKYLAERFNPSEYGENDSQDVNVNLSLADLHLEALRQRGSMNHFPREEEPELLEAEVVE